MRYNRTMGFFDRFRRTDSTQAIPPASRMDAEEDAYIGRATQHTDVWSNPNTGLGLQNSRTNCNTFGFERDRSLHELDTVFEFSGLAARIVNREPDDCVREGMTVKQLDAEQQEDLDTYLTQIKLLPKLADAHRWAKLYGGGAVYMQIDDGLEPSEPVDLSRVKSLDGLVVFDKNDITPVMFDHNLDSPTAREPVIFQVSYVGTSFTVHRSRLLIFNGVRLTPRRMRARNGWGGSYLAQVWTAMEQYKTSHAYLAEAITQLTQGVLKLHGLNSAMKKKNSDLLAARLNALTRAKSMLGDIAIDAGDGEDYVVINRTVTGFLEAHEMTVEDLVIETGMPKSILLGKTEGGLNSGENAGDWETWNTVIGAKQEDEYTPKVQWALAVALSAAASPVRVDDPQDIKIKWNPLRTETEGQKTANLGTVSTSIQTLVVAGVISPDEGRGHRVVQDEFNLTAEEAEAPGDPFGAPEVVPPLDVTPGTATADPPVVAVPSPSEAA